MNPPKKKILIVDDAPLNLKILKNILVNDYKIFVATDGLSALERVESNRPDLILLDVVMPKMDGYEVCKTLKSAASTSDIPIIFISSKSGEEDETKGLELGAVDYITKPFRHSVVLARVKTHLSMRAMQQKLILQNIALIEADKLKVDVERISRHDLKSPLSSVIGFSDMILEDSSFLLTEELRGYLQMIRDSGFKALHMVNLSLDLYRMEQGTYELEPSRIDLVSILKIICGDDNTQKYGQYVSTMILVNDQPISEKQSFMVFGEELLCYSLLSNLLKNALEASPPNKPVTISMLQDKRATITIHNFGVVPLEICGRFFDKYATFGKKHGTGLGTYSARLMVEAQKGEISMETSEDRGTTITITLPANPCTGE